MTTQACVICSGESQLGRFACHWCTEDVRRMLREIELYVAWLPLMTQPGRGGQQGGRAPGFGSRPPARLDVLVALDPRTTLDVTTSERPFDPVVDDDPDNAPRSVLVALESQARMIREELGQEQPTKPPTIGGEITYLLGAVERCAYEPWVDEMADFIRGIHRQLRAIVGDRPPRPLAPCLLVSCDGWVHWSKDVPDPTDPEPDPKRRRKLDAARCAQCGRVYTGMDLVRLRVQEAS